MAAEGIADIYPRLAPTMEWDTTAVIVREAGRMCYDFKLDTPMVMAEHYTKEALKFYGQNGDDILISDAIEYIAQFSMIHGNFG